MPSFLVERDRVNFWVVGLLVDLAANFALEADRESVVRHSLAARFAAFGYFDLPDLVLLGVVRKGFVRVSFEVAVVRG